MNRRHTLLSLLLLVSLRALGQNDISFSDFFRDTTLRIDYYHVGNSSEELVTIDHMYRQGPWAGNPKHLIDPLGYGRYTVMVYDSATGRPIYSKGYDSYFGEYKTTEPARHGTRRTYHESVLTPFPRRTVRVVIAVRNREGQPATLVSTFVDPADYHINTESPRRGDEVIEVVKNGAPHEMVDIAIVADGYTYEEKEKFRRDLQRFAEIFFGLEPYTDLKNKFNIFGIFTPSPESGVDEPRQGSYRNTALGASFNSLDSDRYLLVEDNKTLRDVAAQVPYDVMMVMVNSRRYGGGGFYGYYSTFTSDGPWGDYVFLHEFGHAFGGLADEYYTADVAYEEFYPPGIEPQEPNITRLHDPGKLKWKDQVSPGLQIPTPWGKERYDSLTAERDRSAAESERAIGQLERAGVPKDSIAKVQEKFRLVTKELNDRLIQFMEDHPLRGKIGAFEGGGYLPKGMYRPTVNSIMNQFTKKDRSFYGVSERAIRRVIDYYTQ